MDLRKVEKYESITSSWIECRIKDLTVNDLFRVDEESMESDIWKAIDYPVAINGIWGN